MGPVPQLAQLQATSSVGGLVVEHRAPLTMKDTGPRLSQANPLPSITRRTHPALSPETRTSSYYRYCPWAADSTVPVLFVPASRPPEPEKPPGAGDDAEGVAPLVSEAHGLDAQGPDATVCDVGGSGDADAEADADAWVEDADADT